MSKAELCQTKVREKQCSQRRAWGAPPAVSAEEPGLEKGTSALALKAVLSTSSLHGKQSRMDICVFGLLTCI